MTDSTPIVAPIGFQPVTDELLKEVTERIVEALAPEQVILFGSYADGKPTPDSDVDLLIVMETEKRPSQRRQAVSRLFRDRPFPMDIAGEPALPRAGAAGNTEARGNLAVAGCPASHRREQIQGPQSCRIGVGRVVMALTGCQRAFDFDRHFVEAASQYGFIVEGSRGLFFLVPVA
jgi:predicted nucleotidyltransferase